MTVSGSDLVRLAREHVGEKYVLGARVPKDRRDWKGPWDCAEFVSWVVFQVTGKLVGCLSADAYTGAWQRDCEAGNVIQMPVARAIQLPGAILLRNPRKGRAGHIVFVAGPNQTIEAHSTKRGVVEATILGRRWDCGILIPGVRYSGFMAKP